jgi:hypothetical protein
VRIKQQDPELYRPEFKLFTEEPSEDEEGEGEGGAAGRAGGAPRRLA